jgi:broad specificity phosphatase PhoE
MLICIIRYSETDWNKHGKLQGSENIPLNHDGKRQIEKAVDLKKC